MVNSKKLLSYALTILNECDISPNNWSIGGGTVLAVRYNHRQSKDIDVFIDDPQLLGKLSPRFNSSSEEALYYTEMSNYISLTFPEGKVDFIEGSNITNFKKSTQDFFGHLIPLDDSVEIVCKKIYYRGNQILPRDIFDLATVYMDNYRRKDLMTSICQLPSDKLSIFLDNFQKAYTDKNILLYSREYEDMLLPNGYKLQNKEFLICNKIYQAIRKDNIYTKSR